jgi:hypothetical protein
VVAATLVWLFVNRAVSSFGFPAAAIGLLWQGIALAHEPILLMPLLKFNAR